MNNKMYAKYTSCLYNILEDYPNLLENLVLSTEERTTKFKEMFVSKFFNYESGCETIGLFKLTIENLFKSHKDYYEELLDVYETKINYLDGIKTIHNITNTNNKSSTGSSQTDRTIDRNENLTETINRTNTLETNQTDNKSTTTLPRVAGATSIPSSKDDLTSNIDTTETNTGTIGNVNSFDTTDNVSFTKENTETQNETISDTKTGDVNVVEQRIAYMKQVRNLYEEFVMKFKPCFCQIFN